MNKEYELFGKKINAGTMVAVLLSALAVLLIFSVIIPQIKSIGTQREAITLKEDEVTKLQSSLAALNSVSGERVASDLKVMKEALPTNKDIITIFSSIISLASKTDVQIEGFTLQVGDIYNTDKEKMAGDKIDTSSVTGFPALNVALSLKSDNQEQIVEFTRNLYARLPISRVNTITADKGSSTLEISFYYRPEDLSVLQNTNDIPGYSQESLETLDTLREWREN